MALVHLTDLHGKPIILLINQIVMVEGGECDNERCRVYMANGKYVDVEGTLEKIDEELNIVLGLKQRG